MMTRKISPIAVMRMKYQEKVSNPPPAGRGPYPVEKRITVLLIHRSLLNKPIRLLYAGGGIPCIKTEDRSNHKKSNGNEAHNGKGHRCPEHASLVAHSLRYEVDQHDAYAVKSVIEDGPDQGQGNNAHNGGTEQGDTLVIDFGTKAQ